MSDQRNKNIYLDGNNCSDGNNPCDENEACQRTGAITLTCSCAEGYEMKDGKCSGNLHLFLSYCVVAELADYPKSIVIDCLIVFLLLQVEYSLNIALESQIQVNLLPKGCKICEESEQTLLMFFYCRSQPGYSIFIDFVAAKGLTCILI